MQQHTFRRLLHTNASEQILKFILSFDDINLHYVHIQLNLVMAKSLENKN